MVRRCPKCDREMFYSSNDAIKRAEKNKSKCRSCLITGKKRIPVCAFQGRTHSDESKLKMSLAKIGKAQPTEANKKNSISQHKRWGTEPRDQDFYTDASLRSWSLRVRKRDKYTCAYCDYTNTDTVVHHILSKSKHPELALVDNNGITLCEPCHLNEHSVNGTI